MSKPDDQRPKGRKRPPIPAGFPPWWDGFVQDETARVGRNLAFTRLPAEWQEDIVQELWLRVVQRWDDFQGDDIQEQIRRWITRVVERMIVDHHRLSGRRRAVQFDAGVPEPIDRRGEGIAAHERRNQAIELFHRWLAGLRETDPANHRLMWGRYVEGVSTAELAAETNLTRKAVSRRIERQREHFRIWLAEQGEEEVESA